MTAAFSTLQAAGIFVVIPVGLFLLISLLVVVFSTSEDARYRPGLDWDAAPVWFGGPAATERALSDQEPTQRVGGASARW